MSTLTPSPHTLSTQRPMIAVSYGLGAGALWGLVFIFPVLFPDFSGTLQSVARYLCYGVVSVVMLAPKLRSVLQRTTGRDWLWLIGLSLCGNIVYYQFLSLGVRGAGVAVTSMLIGLLPITTALMGRWIQQRRTSPNTPSSDTTHAPTTLPLRRLIVPLLLILCGLILIHLHGWQQLLQGNLPIEQVLGMLAAIAALGCWTLYSVGNAYYVQRYHHHSQSEWTSLTGLATGGLAAIVGIAQWLIHPEEMNHSADRWAYFALWAMVIGLGASWIGSWLWNMASQRLPMTLSGQLIVSETLFALIYGFILAGQLPTALELAAMVCFFVGVMQAIRAH
jgi:drug/metabolite transporter (DMT)-like permease